MKAEIKKENSFQKTIFSIYPNDWNLIPLAKLAQIATGTTPPTNDKSNYGEDFLFVGPSDLGKTKWILDAEKKLSAKGFNLARRFPKHSILFTCIGSTIGKSGMASKELTSNQQINAIFPNDSYSSDFLFYQLSLLSNFIKKQAGEQAVPLINKSKFGEFIIPFPPTRTEQTAIATALSDMDALIEGLEKLLVKKRNIKQGAMQDLLKPKDGWKIKKLGQIGKTYGGLSGKSKNDFKNGTIPYIPFMNIMSNPIISVTYFDYVKIDASENQNKVQKGDLFFNTSSETPEEVGMCSVLLEDIPNLYLNSFCFGFRFHKETKDDGLYLSYFFRSSYGRKKLYLLAQGATRYNLSKSNFLKIKLELPTPEEQICIAQILYDIDTELNQLETELSKYKMLKTGMMQELLTGKKRLI